LQGSPMHRSPLASLALPFFLVFIITRLSSCPVRGCVVLHVGSLHERINVQSKTKSNHHSFVHKQMNVQSKSKSRKSKHQSPKAAVVAVVALHSLASQTN
jgi:hypothetical protein